MLYDVGHTHRYQIGLKKKKVKSPSPESRVLETGSDPPIWSDRDLGRDKAARFSLMNGQLYKRSLDGLYLKCLTTQQGQYILPELHEGICGNHPSDRTLAHRTHTQGYY